MPASDGQPIAGSRNAVTPVAPFEPSRQGRSNSVHLPFENRSVFGAFPESELPDRLLRLAKEANAAGVSEFDISLAAASTLEDDASVEQIEQSWRRLESFEASFSDAQNCIAGLYIMGRTDILAHLGFLFPAYDVTRAYARNVASPLLAKLPSRPYTDRRWDFLGEQIDFPFGVAASPLTDNAKYIEVLGSNGFNVLTYRTVRSRPTAAAPPPNWVYLTGQDGSLVPGDKLASVHTDTRMWPSLGTQEQSTANYFGVPSLLPLDWQTDLQSSLAAISDGQMLIVSVLGEDYLAQRSPKAVANDFLRTAKQAEAAGARFIELNLSVPNPLKAGPEIPEPVCFDTALTSTIVERVRQSLDSSTRLIVKLAYMETERLRLLVDEIAAWVDCISGINAVRAITLTTDGLPTFSTSETAGVSGAAVRNVALDFVRSLVRIRFEGSHAYQVLAMGGVTDPNSFFALRNAGADVVQAASGVLTNPLLAFDCVQQYGRSLTGLWTLDQDSKNHHYLEDAVLELLDAAPGLSVFDVAAATELPGKAVGAVLERLRLAGLVSARVYAHESRAHTAIYELC